MRWILWTALSLIGMWRTPDVPSGTSRTAVATLCRPTPTDR